jgi:hypothetical protein
MTRDAPGEPPGHPDRELYERYGIDLETLQRMYLEWAQDKVPKSVVEARYLRTRKHHGKLFNKLVRTYLGIETQQPHPLNVKIHEIERENQRLRDLLRHHGIDPNEAIGSTSSNQERPSYE